MCNKRDEKEKEKEKEEEEEEEERLPTLPRCKLVCGNMGPPPFFA